MTKSMMFKDACGPAHMKVDSGNGRSADAAQRRPRQHGGYDGGADFIKTSTGKEAVNATLPVGLVMTRAIRAYFEGTGMEVGFKPAGGLRTAKQAMEWLFLMKEELGRRWLEPDLFRFGASGMLTDIERQLEHFATGRYSANYRQPMV